MGVGAEAETLMVDMDTGVLLDNSGAISPLRC